MRCNTSVGGSGAPQRPDDNVIVGTVSPDTWPRGPLRGKPQCWLYLPHRTLKVTAQSLQRKQWRRRWHRLYYQLRQGGSMWSSLKTSCRR
jgi:hypothetical protein